jgi:hypothetical protein
MRLSDKVEVDGRHSDSRARRPVGVCLGEDQSEASTV